MDEHTKLGPNVKALLIERWSQLMCARAGHAGGKFGKVAAVAARMADKQGQDLKADMRDAFTWVQSALTAVKSSPDNPYDTDEAIAGAIMKRVKEQRRAIQ